MINFFMLCKHIITLFLVIMFHTSFGWCSQQKNKPHVISLNGATRTWGGGATHSLSLYKLFIAHGYDMTLLVSPTSLMTSGLQSLQIPHQLIDDFQPILKTLCKQKKQIVVLSNSHTDAALAKHYAKEFKFPIIHFQHHYALEPFDTLSDVAATVCVNPEIVTALKKAHQTKKLNIKKIEFLPPFFDESRFKKFSPSRENQEEFFLKRFGIVLKKAPVISVIANFYNDIKHKNHPVLFQAIHRLIYEKQKFVNVILIGDGPARDLIQSMIAALNLQEYIHILGSTMDVPAVLYYSDFHILPSSREAFGIANVDAALMHKASIGAHGTGSALTIKNGATGLLFKNNNSDDLAKKIEFLLDHKKLQKRMGNAAYKFVRKNLSSNPHFKKLEQLIKKSLNS